MNTPLFIAIIIVVILLLFTVYAISNEIKRKKDYIKHGNNFIKEARNWISVCNWLNTTYKASKMDEFNIEELDNIKGIQHLLEYEASLQELFKRFQYVSKRNGIDISDINIPFDDVYNIVKRIS